MIEKDKDLFLDMLENPDLTLEDLVSVGHSAQSTRFLDKSAYENSQRVRSKFMDEEGNFKQNEFDNWYKVAENAYQALTNVDANLSLLNVTSFNESDITVSPEKRTLNTAPLVSFSPNPDRTSTGIYRIGKTSERERTLSELAQAEKVLLNPVEAAKDPSKARWGDSPNDSWWGNFFDTQVLAQWDEDGEHIDPVTKQKVNHKKGDLKLNDNGTYYYEALDGRDIYGRQVLNKLNTITTDGSFWNQYDFFDSDDIKEKSFVGSVAKNLALVGSMFIPYVGWGIAGASVAVQLTGLAGTLGKMLSGSDSPTFSAMEGWAKSLNRQTAKSEYAQQNMLCWENFIDLIGDTTALLREQRAIFKFAPAIFGKGKYGIESKHFGANTGALLEKESTALRLAANPNLSLGQMARAVGGDDVRGALSTANSFKENMISRYAQNTVKNYLEDYNKLGEKLARAYMVGITVGDTYGEAKQAGANDFEATLLTIGYAAAENKLLSSEIGRWIFPELKAEKAKMAQIAKRAIEPKAITADGIEDTLRRSGVSKTKAELIGKRIAEMPLDVRNASNILNKLPDEGKMAWMKKWFNAGKDIFDQQKSIMGGTAKAMFSNALAEGTEEVSEELLKDFSYSCFNLVKAATGDKETRMQGFLGEWDWSEALKRYGMSFVGGLIGGGINSAAYDYRQFKDIANMSSESAIQQLVWMDRNNELDKFWDVVSKQTLGDKYHSIEQNEDGTFKLGDANNNQDLEVKRAIRQQIDLIHNILTANGASLDDEGLISQVMHALPNAQSLDILGEFRTDALATSVTAGRFLKEYNNLCKAIVMESFKLKSLKDQVPDSGTPDENLQAAINESLDSLNTLKQAKNDLLEGKRSLEFYRDALFETTYGVSESFISATEVQYAEMCTGRPYSLLSQEEKQEMSRKYADWSRTERSEKIHQLADIFYSTTQKTSKALLDSALNYEKIKQGLLKHIKTLTDLSLSKLDMLMHVLTFEQEDPITELQNVLLAKLGDPKDNLAGMSIDPVGDYVVGNGTISELQGALIGNEGEPYINRILLISEDQSLSENDKLTQMSTAFIENLCNLLTDAAKQVLEMGYVHPEVKYNLVKTLTLTGEYCGTLFELFSKLEADLEYSDPDAAMKAAEQYDILNRKQLELEDYVNQINELQYTPITKNLKTFGLSLGVNLNVLSLIEDAIKKELDYSTSLDNVILDETQLKQFEEAENLLKLYRASIVASRTDNVDVEHIFGYNKVLNELCGNMDGYQQLAEIDKETADLAVQDVTLALDRLNTIKEISALNQGNKLNVQNFASANKSYILFNKSRKFIRALSDTDDKEFKDKWNKNGAIDKLKAVIDSLSSHAEWTNDEVTERKLSLNTEEKLKLEQEQHKFDDAIYLFFQDNQDKLANTESSKKDLAEFIRKLKFDLYDKNEGLLTHVSKDIDDGAFIWWLASKAALKGSDFYKVYKDVISDDVAPIPTQEIGVFAAIAAVSNGNVFNAFQQAMRQAIIDDWSSKSDVKRKNGKIDDSLPSEKLNLIRQKGLAEYLPESNDDIDLLYRSDLVPTFNRILFIEGAPGTGKSTGVFKTIVKLLKKMKRKEGNNEVPFLSKQVFIAHSTKENADKLAHNLEFDDGTKVLTFDKDGLLKFASAQFENTYDKEKGCYIYVDGKNCIITPEGELHSKWKVKPLLKEEIPSIIFIDEWSRYTQPEVDLIHRFASTYGIQVIAGGDLDQLSPRAYLLATQDSLIKDKTTLLLQNARNIVPRIPKLGISMRSGNGQKVLNLQTLQGWKRNKTALPVNLLYVETENELFGDKVYVQNGEITDLQLESIKKDIDKFVASLRENEKIGYIFHNTDSKLYKLLQQDLYKDKIEFLNETAAQGREAKFYIVENNRDTNQNEDDYYASYYTGISRAEQASISIVAQNPIGQLLIRNPKNQENKLIPDNFTPEGITRFSKQRKTLLERIYGNGSNYDLPTVIDTDRIDVPLIKRNLQHQDNGSSNSGNGNNGGTNTGSNDPNGNNPPNPPTPPSPPAPPTGTNNGNNGSRTDTTGGNDGSSGTDPISPQSNPNIPQAMFKKGDCLTDGNMIYTVENVSYIGSEYLYKIKNGSDVFVVTEDEIQQRGLSYTEPPAPPVKAPTNASPSGTDNKSGGTNLATDSTVLEVNTDNINMVFNAMEKVAKKISGDDNNLIATEKDIANYLAVNTGDLTKVLDHIFENSGIEYRNGFIIPIDINKWNEIITNALDIQYNKLKVTSSSLQGVYNTIIKQGTVNLNNGSISIQISDLLLLLNTTNPHYLDDVLNELINLNAVIIRDNAIFVPNDKNLQTAILDLIKNKYNTVPPSTDSEEDTETVPESSFKVGDFVILNISGAEIRHEITKVEYDPDAKLYKYTLVNGTSQQILPENTIKDLDSKGKVILKEEVLTPDGATLQPQSLETLGDRTDLEQFLEQTVETQQPPVIEIQDNGEDIDPRILGHTWNTNYIGVNVDDEGKLILPQQNEPGAKRIDNANGLIKLNPDKFVDPNECRKTLGIIRRSMMFDSNTDIEKVIKSQIPVLQNQKLKLEWMFISKSKQHVKDDGGRFYYDDSMKLDYMEKQDQKEVIPTKMLSLVVLDENNNAVLEIPLITLSSPFTLLYKLGTINSANPIYKAYIDATKNSRNEQEVLQKVIREIESRKELRTDRGNLKPGYKRLRDLCKLWQFTSDGIRQLTKLRDVNEKFNLHQHCKNLGSKYVKNRVTELTVVGKNNPYDYSMIWHDLTEVAQRQDVTFSSMMLATSDYNDFDRITAAGHPFVLRSDSLAYQSDEDMMNRYLEQQADQTLEKIITLIPLSPPEISIADYLKERVKLKDCHYGNQFTAYKILSLIKKYDIDFYNLKLSMKTRNEINDMIDALDLIVVQQEEGQTLSDAKVQRNQIMKEKMKELGAIERLSSALFEMTMDYNGNAENSKVVIDEIANRIQEICNAHLMTGIMYRCVCQKAENVDKVGGYGILLEHGSNKYTSPDGRSFRIYSRYDTPIFDLTDVLSNFVSIWASQATQGFEAPNGERFDNVWYFDDNGRKDFAKMFYEANGNTKKPPKKSKNLELKEKYSNLLEKLNLKDYDKLNGVSDQTKFLEIIRDAYIEKPGNIAFVVGDKLIYTNLNNEGLNGSLKFPEEFANAIQQSFEKNDIGDGSYTLTIKIGDQTLELNVELIDSIDNSELIIDLGKPDSEPETPPIPAPVAEQQINPAVYDEAMNKLQEEILKKKGSKMGDLLQSWFDIIKEGKEKNKTHKEIVDEINATLNRVNAMLFNKTVGKDFLNVEETQETQDETQKQDVVEEQRNDQICSIRVHKKFMK